MDNDIIKFLDSKTKEKLKYLEVNDRTNILIDSKRVLTMRRLIQHVENKIHEMKVEVASLKRILTNLLKLGFPPPWDGKGDIISQNKYPEKLE